VPGTSLAAINSDLAFKGNLVIEGHWNGFRIIDASDPANPVQLSNYEQCVHPSGQGDVVVYGNILVRTRDSANSAQAWTCGGEAVLPGFEGIHIFDISDPANPVYIRKLRMAATGNDAGAPTVGCGAHTATAVPDPARDNLYLYVGGSSGTCQGIDIVRIKISDPTNATYVARAAASRQCHDNNVLMGNVNLAMCAGGNGFSVFRFDPALNPADPGGIENPTLLYSRQVPGVGIAHSGSFAYDGKVLIFGHEPGGGTSARCQATSTTTERTLFFYEPETGTQLGTLVQPRPQTAQENCTWHNFNVVPTYKGRVAVVGSYQMGITAIDFTDPAAPQQFVFADPAPLVRTPRPPSSRASARWRTARRSPPVRSVTSSSRSPRPTWPATSRPRRSSTAS
jgi:LVIVD repeat